MPLPRKSQLFETFCYLGDLTPELEAMAARLPKRQLKLKLSPHQPKAAPAPGREDLNDPLVCAAFMFYGLVNSPGFRLIAKIDPSFISNFESLLLALCPGMIEESFPGAEDSYMDQVDQYHKLEDESPTH